MAFNNIDDQLTFIALKGNYVDIMNTLALLNAFNKTWSTGRVPGVRKFRGGKEASAVANLQMTMVAATGRSNAMHEYNIMRDKFLSIVAELQPGVYAAVDAGQYSRLGIVATPAFPVDVEDCEATVLGTATNLAEYLTLWNETKVDADRALCSGKVNYLVDTGVAGFLLESKIQPDNSKIIYNAPKGITKFEQRKEFVENRKQVTNSETKVDPKSVANRSVDNV